MVCSHGVNIAGTSLDGIGGSRKIFGQLQLMDVDHLPKTLQVDTVRVNSLEQAMQLINDQRSRVRQRHLHFHP